MKKIYLKHIYEKIYIARQKGQRFVLFREPNSKKVQLYIDNPKFTNKKRYFIISNLNHEHQIKIFPDKVFYAKINELLDSKNQYFPYYYNKPDIKYIQMLKKSLLGIKSGQIEKVVLSRIKKISFKNIFLKKSFQNLIITYPESFVYLWYDIIHGFWIGATPELLLKSNSVNRFQTIAMAGTLKAGQNKIQWSIKEIEEHYIVIQHIEKILKKYQAKIYISHTKNSISGQIKHLKTLIDFSFRKQLDINNLIKDLHPTPSVCGLPKNTALEFIRKNEGYSRGFYTGYLGVFNKEITSLYVNLRCARIYQKEITFYAGGGITKQSNPKKEWLETQLKIENILSQLVFSSPSIPSSLSYLDEPFGRDV